MSWRLTELVEELVAEARALRERHGSDHVASPEKVRRRLEELPLWQRYDIVSMSLEALVVFHIPALLLPQARLSKDPTAMALLLDADSAAADRARGGRPRSPPPVPTIEDVTDPVEREFLVEVRDAIRAGRIEPLPWPVPEHDREMARARAELKLPTPLQHGEQSSTES